MNYVIRIDPPDPPPREHLASQEERRHCSNDSLRSCAAIVFGFHGSRCIFGAGAVAPWRPSCHVDDRLNLSGFKHADVAFNRLIHAVWPLQQCWKPRQIRCVLLRRLSGSEQEAAISFLYGAWEWEQKVGLFLCDGKWELQAEAPGIRTVQEGSSSPNHLLTV